MEVLLLFVQLQTVRSHSVPFPGPMMWLLYYFCLSYRWCKWVKLQQFHLLCCHHSTPSHSRFSAALHFLPAHTKDKSHSTLLHRMCWNRFIFPYHHNVNTVCNKVVIATLKFDYGLLAQCNGCGMELWVHCSHTLHYFLALLMLLWESTLQKLISIELV